MHCLDEDFDIDLFACYVSYNNIIRTEIKFEEIIIGLHQARSVLSRPSLRGPSHGSLDPKLD